VWSHVDARVDTGDPLLPSTKETTAGPHAVLFVDQTDHAFFPTTGYRLTATAYSAMESFGSTQSYRRLEGSLQGATSWGKNTINYAVSGGTDLDSDMPAYESFTLGGPLRLSGYRVNQFMGNQYSFGRLMYYRQTLHLPDLLGSGVYLGGSAEIGRISQRSSGLPDAGTLWSGSVFLGADTFLGPLYFGVGAGGSGHWSLYLLLGRP